MRPIDGEELYQIESLLKTDVVEKDSVANWLISQVLHDIEASPTVDPESFAVVKELRAELKRYKDLNVTPDQIVLLIKFFKDRTSAEHIALDMKLVADSIRKEQLEKELCNIREINNA